MRRKLLAMIFPILASCSSAGPDLVDNSHGVGISITQLSTSISILTGEVDVRVAVKNEYHLPLKSVRIYLVSYDHDQKLIRTTNATIDVPGPIASNQQSDSLEFKAVMRNRDVRCVAVARVEALRMDYVILFATGREANELVKDPRKACVAD